MSSTHASARLVVHMDAAELRELIRTELQQASGAQTKLPESDQRPQRVNLTRKEAAARLDLSVRTIDYFVQNKVLNVVRFGMTVLIPVAEIERVEREGLPRMTKSGQPKAQPAPLPAAPATSLFGGKRHRGGRPRKAAPAAPGGGSAA